MALEEIIARRIRQSDSLEELAFILQKLFENNSVWTDGRLLTIRALVGYANGLKIEVYPNEHPPAHFHVRGGDVNASFSIENCRLLGGNTNGREHDLVLFWYKDARPQLIRKWNQTRPANCPVGPIPE